MSINKSTNSVKSILDTTSSTIKSASNKIQRNFSSLIPNQSEISSTLDLEEPNVSEGSSFFKYLIIFCLVLFLLIMIIVRFELVPKNLGDFLNNFNLYPNMPNKSTNTPPINTRVGNTKVKDKSNKIPEVKKISKRAETSAPVHLPQQGNPLPEPDESDSLTQSPRNKSGYCYIGEDRGFRSCIRVDESEECMSGDIFPTAAICINPNLRQ